MADNDKNDAGCGAVLGVMFLFLVATILIACLPAIPLLLFGQSFLAGIAYIVIGLPLGIIVSCIIVAALAKMGEDDGGDGGDGEPEPDQPPDDGIKEPVPNNRLAEYFKVHPN